jgi:hypothetical protein
MKLDRSDEMKKLVIGMVAIAAVGGGWYYGSPLWTLKSMRDAAVAKDAKSLSAYVDFPALRADVKSDLKAQMGAVKADDSLGGLGAMFTNALSDKMIDGLVTPETLGAMMTMGKGASALTGSQGADKAGKDKEPDYEIIRGLSEFRVRPKDKSGSEIPAMVFTRSGISWKLSGIDLPPIGKTSVPSPF